MLLWKSGPVRRTTGCVDELDAVRRIVRRLGAIEVEIPRAFLHAGTYRLDVYGIDRDGAHLRESYRLRATP